MPFVTITTFQSLTSQFKRHHSRSVGVCSIYIYIPQPICYSRVRNMYYDLIERNRLLTQMPQGYVVQKFQLSHLKFYGHRHDLVFKSIILILNERGPVPLTSFTHTKHVVNNMSLFRNTSL